MYFSTAVPLLECPSVPLFYSVVNIAVWDRSVYFIWYVLLMRGSAISVTDKRTKISKKLQIHLIVLQITHKKRIELLHVIIDTYIVIHSDFYIFFRFFLSFRKITMKTN